MGKNAETCALLISQAAGEGASLLVLPEALLARDDLDPDLSVKSGSAFGRWVSDAFVARKRTK